MLDAKSLKHKGTERWGIPEFIDRYERNYDCWVVSGVINQPAAIMFCNTWLTTRLYPKEGSATYLLSIVQVQLMANVSIWE